MSERKVNLEKILNKQLIFYPSHVKNEVLIAMKEACRQVLELASENATAKQDKIRTYPYEDFLGMYHDEKVIIVDKQSIINTINQVE